VAVAVAHLRARAVLQQRDDRARVAVERGLRERRRAVLLLREVQVRAAFR